MACTDCRVGRIVSWCLLALSVFSAACHDGGDKNTAQHDHDGVIGHDFERGPHGGRLLRDDDFSVELTVFETGVPPRFRVYGYLSNKPIAAGDFTARIGISRLGGVSESFELSPTGDFLTSNREVLEPHSFDVEVKASFRDHGYSWSYSSPEGRITMPNDVADSSGVLVERAERREIRTSRKIRGKIVPSEHRIAHIIPRFSGVVREGRKHIGDRVEKGEVLAVIESNQSLQPFEVRSQISGTVINGHLIVGEFVPENQWVYIVADLSEVWVDFLVPLIDRGDLQIGQDIEIHTQDRDRIFSGEISYVAPYADERSQSQLVRAVIPNQSGVLLPGTFVTADLVVDRATAPVAIKRSALQKMGDKDVVFVRYGETYEARPVTLGKADHLWVEVLQGVLAGDHYVAGNSFLIKADILKSGASHDH